MSLLGRAAVLIWNDVLDSAETAFYQWHDNEHIPERLALPGFRRGRRYRGGGEPAWLTVYEADDLGVLTSPAYLERLDHPTPATRETVKSFRNTARSICRVERSTGGSTGGHALTLRLPGDAGLDVEAAFAALPAATGVLAMHLLAADDAASRIDTAESRERAFVVPPRVLMVETSTLAAARAALDRLGEMTRAIDDAARPGLAAGAGIFSLEICRLPAP
ncbi:hypothetical protein [Burkholderia plantarii]|uniref:Uncharacterized protein n=1 Tax=Burkholderia plantarii TaxID=41899 RepID=A0A0B6RSF0_BURPL|nr:hypothetical protein [Burkholderia plantarii]AJK48262.1 hypothetical protein BGL_2c01660 [Burkholderia plantarii]